MPINCQIITAPIVIISYVLIVAFEINCDASFTPTVGIVVGDWHVILAIDQPDRPDTEPVYVVIGTYVPFHHQTRDYSQDLVEFKIRELSPWETVFDIWQIFHACGLLELLLWNICFIVHKLCSTFYNIYMKISYYFFHEQVSPRLWSHHAWVLLQKRL